MEDLQKKLIDRFGNNRVLSLIKSPLRICPIGAHVDHQKGLVTGMTLDASIDMAYTSNESGYIIVQSLDFPDEEYFHIDTIPSILPGYWGNYLHGAVLSLKRKYKIQKGINAVIRGKHPIGGLSSSAAVITAYLLALYDVNGIYPDKNEIIENSHWVETAFIGLNNGILDQSVNILSQDEHLLFMDCSTSDYKLIPKPMTMKEFEIVVVYSGLSKALIKTDYNNRVDECKVAAWVLQELAGGVQKPLRDTYLRDVDVHIFNKEKDLLPGRLARRAEHFFSENRRVIEGVKAWERGDIVDFGKLMFESGESSIYNYECGCPELITIFNILKGCPGVYGARFSGAGYRGCCIGFVDPKYKDEIKSRIDVEYPKSHPEYKNSYKVYFNKTDGGARIIR